MYGSRPTGLETGLEGYPGLGDATPLAQDPFNPNNYLLPNQPGLPPISIPKMYGGQSTQFPGYAQDQAGIESGMVGGTIYTDPVTGQATRTNPAGPLMAKVEALLGTAAGVFADGSTGAAGILDAYGPQSTGIKFTLNADGYSFSGSDGKSYSAPEVKAILTTSSAPIVQQHVDVPQIVATPGVDPNAPPNGWRSGSYRGTAGYWFTDGKFYAGPTPWLNPNAVGVSLVPDAPPPASGPPPAPVYTNPDGTPTYNGKPYDANDQGNPYNHPSNYSPGGVVGPPTPGGGQSSPTPPMTFAPTGPMTYGDPGAPPPTDVTGVAPAQASIFGAITPTKLAIAAVLAFFLLRPRRS